MRAALSAAVSATHASHRPIAHVAGRDDGGKPRVLLLAAAVDPQSDPWILLKAKRHHGAFTIGAPASLEHLVSVEHESPSAFRLIFDEPHSTLGWTADEIDDADTFVAAVAECVLGVDLGTELGTSETDNDDLEDQLSSSPVAPAPRHSHSARSGGGPAASDEHSPLLDARAPHSPSSDTRSASTVVTEPDVGPSHPPLSPGTPKRSSSTSDVGWVDPFFHTRARPRHAHMESGPDASPSIDTRRPMRHEASPRNPNRNPDLDPNPDSNSRIKAKLPAQLRRPAEQPISRRGHTRPPDQPVTPSVSPRPMQDEWNDADEDTATPRAHAPQHGLSRRIASTDPAHPSLVEPLPGRRGWPAARLFRSDDTLPPFPALLLPEHGSANASDEATTRPRGHRVAKSAVASAGAAAPKRARGTGRQVPKLIPVGKRRRRRGRPFDPRAFEQRLVEGTGHESIGAALKAMQRVQVNSRNRNFGRARPNPAPLPDPADAVAVEDDEAAWAEAEELLSTIEYGLNSTGERRTVRAGDAIGATLQAELNAAEGGYHMGLLGAVGGYSRPWRPARPARRTGLQHRILSALGWGQDDEEDGTTWSVMEDDDGVWGMFDSSEVDALLDGVEASLEELEHLGGMLDSATEGMLSAAPDVTAIRKKRHGEQLAAANAQALKHELADLVASGRLPKRATARDRSTTRMGPARLSSKYPRQDSNRRSMDIAYRPRKSIDVARLEQRRSMDIGRINRRLSMDVGRIGSRMSMDVGRVDQRRTTALGRGGPRRSMESGRPESRRAPAPRRSVDVGQIDTRKSLDDGRIDPRRSFNAGQPHPRPRKTSGHWEHDQHVAPPRRSMDVSHSNRRPPMVRRAISGTEESMLAASQRMSMDQWRKNMVPPSRSSIARPVSSMGADMSADPLRDVLPPQPQMSVAEATDLLLSAPLTAHGDNVAKLEAAAVEVYKSYLSSADSHALETVDRFASRFVTFARQMLAVSVSRPISLPSPTPASGNPVRPPQGLALSKAIESALEPYCGLVLFIREMAPGSYRALIDEYVAAVSGACYNASQWELPPAPSPSTSNAASQAPGALFAASLTATVRLIHAVAGLMATQHSFVVDFLHLSPVRITFADYLSLDPELVAQAYELQQSGAGRQGDIRLEPVLDQIFAHAVHAVQARVDQERGRGLAPVALLAGLESALAPPTGSDAPSTEGMEYALSTLKGVWTRLLADVEDLVQKEAGMLQHTFDTAPSLVPTQQEKSGLNRKLTLKRRGSMQMHNGNEVHILLCTGRVSDWLLQAEAQLRLAARATGTPVPRPKGTQARLNAAGEKLGRTAVELINARAGMARRFASHTPEVYGQLVRVVNLEAMHAEALRARGKAACRPLDELTSHTERALRGAVTGYADAMLDPSWGGMRAFLAHVEQVSDPLRQAGTGAHAWAQLVEEYSPEAVRMLVAGLGRSVGTQYHVGAGTADGTAVTARPAQLVWTAMERAMARDVDTFRALALNVFRSDPSGSALDVLAWAVDGSSIASWFADASPLAGSTV